MKLSEADFILGTTKENEFPNLNLPEYAFCGRSNVGKSSLLNSIVLRKNLAHISSTPGKTQQINFYKINKKWIFADLPGYGYAKVSKSEREMWKNMIYSYLKNRKNLRFVCVLVDSRHEPMESDLEFIEWLELNEIRYIIIMTKTDKVKPKAVDELLKKYHFLLSLCKNFIDIIPYSSLKNVGRENLLAVIKREAS